MTNFKDLNLNAKILSALDKKGYTQPTPIQEQAIPHLLNGKDLLGIAQTGTGKTAAFSLPILHNLAESNRKVTFNHVRALILTPTRELATQIADNVKVYGQGLGLSHNVILGGVSINNQVRDMQRGCDIMIATPGRLLDLVARGAAILSKVEILVLDEADRMLDMGFINDVKKVIAKLPKERQTLFFSATMAGDIGKLAASILKSPVKVEITPQSTTVEKIDQRLCYIDKGNKPLLLKSILEQDDATSVLVFSKTKHGANRISKFLESSEIKSAAIHGNKTQAAREKALNDFRRGKVKVLIATDIAARGIDVPDISHVINFDIPHDPENYVHRIGRTARAGRNGVAISFCDPSERAFLKAIEKTIRYEIPVDKSHAFHGAKSSGILKEFVDDRPQRGGGFGRGGAGARSGGFGGLSGGRSGGASGGRSGGASGARSSSFGGARSGGNSRFGGGASGGRSSNSDRPRSSDSSSKPARPRFSGARNDDRPVSYFAENRRRKDGFEDGRTHNAKPKFSRDGDKPRFAPRDGERKPAFSRDGDKPRFSRDNDSRGNSDSRFKPRDGERSSKPYLADKKPSKFGAFKKIGSVFSKNKNSDERSFDRAKPAGKFGDKKRDYKGGGEKKAGEFLDKKKSFGRSFPSKSFDSRDSRPSSTAPKRKFGGAKPGGRNKSFSKK